MAKALLILALLFAPQRFGHVEVTSSDDWDLMVAHEIADAKLARMMNRI